jgi:capsular polysaccharide biosynthesis protein
MIGPSEIGAIGKAPVSLRGLAGALRRAWRLICFGALVGLGLGLALTLVLKPTYISTSAVLLKRIPTEDVNPLSAQATEAAIAQSETIAKRVDDKLDLPLTPLRLTRKYGTVVVSDNVLRFVVRWNTSEGAMAIADSLAQELLAYRSEKLSAQTELLAGSSNSRLTQIRVQLDDTVNQLEQLNVQLGGEADAATSRQIESLNLQRDLLANEVISLEERIDSTVLAARVADATSGIVQTAERPKLPIFPNPYTDVVVGIFIGLVGSVAFILLREVLSPRLRLRQEFASATRAPIIAELPWSLERRRSEGRRSANWSASSRIKVMGDLLWALRADDRRDGVDRLVVVSARSDQTTARLVAMWSMELAGRGSVTIDLVGEGESLLKKALASADRSGQSAGRIEIRTLSTHVLPIPTSTRTHLVVALSQSRRDWLMLAGAFRAAVCVVSVGAASAEAVNGIACDLEALQIGLLGSILASPDQRDDTSGYPAPSIAPPRAS